MSAITLQGRRGGAVAQLVVLVSSDPLLGTSLNVLSRGRLRVTRIDPSHRPSAWPGKATSTVVLDLGTKDWAATYPWVRQHHRGRLVVLLRPGQPESSLPPDPERLTLRRPLGLSDLVEILTDPAASSGSADRSISAPVARLMADRELADPAVVQADTKQNRLRLRPRSISAGPAPTVTSSPAAASGTQAIPPTQSTRNSRPSPPPHETPPRSVRPEATAAEMKAARPTTPPAPGGRQPAAGASPPPSRSPVGGRLGVWLSRGPESRRRMMVLGGLVGTLGVLVLIGGWLALGLLQAREDLRAGATGFRIQLTKAEGALRGGDPAAAKTAIQAASRDLDAAEVTMARPPMRVAARLPVLAGSMGDARHLLAAARNLVSAGDQAIAVSVHLQSGRFAVLKGGRFDLDALNDAIARTKGLIDELEGVRAKLALVRGGPLAPGADETKRWALERLDEAVARARPVVPTLQALPAALGARNARTYLVVLANPAELRPGGGAPLAVLEVVVDKGVVEVKARAGEIVENIHNDQTTWTAVTGDPWARGGRFTQFSLANSSPHFPTSGQELLRAYAARGRATPDGVIAIDPLAMRALLRATGPVTVPGFGQLTADNCVQRTTHDAYVRWPNREQRRRYHETLLSTLVERLLSGRDLVTTGKVLGAAGARRQMQIYAADPALQRVLAGNRMYGGLSQAEHDYLAVYTLNTNGSRMDYFQRRSIHQLVQLRPDGSAEVTRTIEVHNDVPPSEPVQDGAETGYSSGRLAAVLANYLPPGATLQGTTRDGRPVRPFVARERGRPLVRFNLDLAPGQSASFTVRYLTPNAAVGERGLRYRLTADPQVLVRAPSLRIDVVAPPGMKISAAPGWAMEEATLTLRRRFTDAVDTTFDLRG
jgi:Protein of unknown function (DUF4012)